MKLERAALAAIMLGLGATARAGDLKLGSAVDTLAISGDLRIRDEYADYKDQESSTMFSGIKQDRNRERFRLRMKFDYKLTDGLDVVAKLASGGGEAVSTNQTFTGGAQQKQLWIDQAFVGWDPGFLGDNGTLKLTAGRMGNPLWLVPENVAWDTDVNPEGFGQQFTYLVADSVNVFGNAMQYAVNEVAGSTSDPWELSEQIGAEIPLPMSLRLKAAVGRDTYLYEQVNSLGTNPVQHGNTRLNGVLLNEYSMDNISGELSSWIPVPGLDINVPFVITGQILQNTQAKGPQWTGSVNGNANAPVTKYIKGDGKTFLGMSNQGLVVGAQLGKAKAAGTWEVSWYYKRIEWDATVADMADSDFGGTNHKANIVTIKYAITDSTSFAIKTFNNERLLDKRYETNAKGQVAAPDHYDLYQFDLVMSF